MEFTLTTAQQYASSNQLEDWIHAYLSTGEWSNMGLSNGLKLQKRWWMGPVEVPLESLIRCGGPEPHLEYRMNPADWERRVTAIATTLDDVKDLPPLIVQYRSGEYSIRDGNHRHEAIKRKGWLTCWVLIWYDDPDVWRNSPFQR